MADIIENNTDGQERTEKRHYLNKKVKDFIHVPFDFRNEMLSASENQSLVNAPISAMRIIFKIVNDVSYDQFLVDDDKNTNQTKLKLFENDFMSDHSSCARFTFDTKDIDKHNDYVAIQTGLDFLLNYKRGWYKTRSEITGKYIKTNSAFIEKASITEGKITFIMTHYFMKKLVAMKHYNPSLFKIGWIFDDTKKLLIFFWICTLGKNGQSVNWDKFQKTYNYNYKSAYEFCRNVLKKLKDKLDEYSNVSFNYKIVDKTNIYFIKYETKKTKIEVDKKTISKMEITQKLAYWKKRHNLDADSIKLFRHYIKLDSSAFKIFVEAYALLVKESRGKLKMSSLQSYEFLKIYQEYIIKYYNESSFNLFVKNGYPIIYNQL